MDKLKSQLDALLNRLDDADDIRVQLLNLVSVYPFGEYEYNIILIPVFIGERSIG